MGNSLARQLIADHLVEGEMRPGEEIALKIDQFLLHDGTGPLCALQLEAMGVEQISDNLSTDEIVAGGVTGLSLWSSLPGTTSIAFEPVDESYVTRARECHGNGHAIIGGRNYGQGSSREQAALAVRNLGARVVLAHSIARIHGENLVNYGVLPLLFVEPGDLGRLEQGTVLRLRGLRTWLRGPEQEWEIAYGHGGRSEGRSGCGTACRRAKSTFCSPVAPSPGRGSAAPTVKPKKKPQSPSQPLSTGVQNEDSSAAR